MKTEAYFRQLDREWGEREDRLAEIRAQIRERDAGDIFSHDEIGSDAQSIAERMADTENKAARELYNDTEDTCGSHG